MADLLTRNNEFFVPSAHNETTGQDCGENRAMLKKETNVPFLELDKNEDVSTWFSNYGSDDEYAGRAAKPTTWKLETDAIGVRVLRYHGVDEAKQAMVTAIIPGCGVCVERRSDICPIQNVNPPLIQPAGGITRLDITFA